MIKTATLFFGKVPGHGDFVRSNAAGPEIKAFDHWLQEAIYKASRHFAGDWPRVFRDSPAYDFVFFADGSEAGLAGVLMPSHDHSGRQYPFIVAGLIGKRELGRGASLAPLAFADFFRGSLRLAEEAVSGKHSLPEITSGVNDLTSSLEPPNELGGRVFEAYIRSTTWGRFCERLFGDFETPRKYLLAHNLIESLRPSNRAFSPLPSVGVRFPIAPSLDRRGEEVSFWNHLALSLYEEHSVLPGMFWEATERSTMAYHFLAPARLPVRLYFSLVQPGSPNDGVCRLDEEEAVNGGREIPRLPQRIKMALENPDIVLEELLRVF